MIGHAAPVPPFQCESRQVDALQHVARVQHILLPRGLVGRGEYQGQPPQRAPRGRVLFAHSLRQPLLREFLFTLCASLALIVRPLQIWVGIVMMNIITG